MTKVLSGMNEIQAYVKRDARVIRRWIKKKGFPAKKIDGRWESDTGMVTEWRRDRITSK